jgi:all-trans-retinol dehydrogenase (NAD+)
MIIILILIILSLYSFYAFLKTQGYLPKKQVKGLHILITGAGSGIGKEMALKFVKLGAKVSILSLHMEHS